MYYIHCLSLCLSVCLSQAPVTDGEIKKCGKLFRTPNSHKRPCHFRQTTSEVKSLGLAVTQVHNKSTDEWMALDFRTRWSCVLRNCRVLIDRQGHSRGPSVRGVWAQELRACVVQICCVDWKQHESSWSCLSWWLRLESQEVQRQEACHNLYHVTHTL